MVDGSLGGACEDWAALPDALTADQNRRAAARASSAVGSAAAAGTAGRRHPRKRNFPTRFLPPTPHDTRAIPPPQQLAPGRPHGTTRPTWTGFAPVGVAQSTPP